MDFTDVVVLCIGDVMLDRFMHGEVERISPEAPIPIIRLTRTDEMLGGSGNVAHNIASLGGQALLLGLIGNDEPGDVLEGLAKCVANIEPHFVRTAQRPTICKMRFIASQQQVVRADEESRLPLQTNEEMSLLMAVDALLPRASVVVLSDYGKGVLTPALIAKVMEQARARGIGVFVDPKTDNFSRYRGATCITPNLKELAIASGLSVGGDATTEIAARAVMADAEADAILVTRSERGMMLVQIDHPSQSVPALAREVFDVSGAGDTVIATLSLAYASGLSLEQSMSIANAAAGVVVSKLGTATATVGEVLQELENQDHASGHELPGLKSSQITQTTVARWRRQGLRVGFTNGCFDIVHPGHVSLLKAARMACDRLVVALNTDASVSRLKGPNRPVNDLQHRAQVVAALRYVDCVVAFDEPTPLSLIKQLQPDVLVKGADYKLEDVIGAEEVTAAGGRVVIAKLIPRQSSTDVIKRIWSLHNSTTHTTN